MWICKTTCNRSKNFEMQIILSLKKNRYVYYLHAGVGNHIAEPIVCSYPNPIQLYLQYPAIHTTANNIKFSLFFFFSWRSRMFMFEHCFFILIYTCIYIVFCSCTFPFLPKSVFFQHFSVMWVCVRLPFAPLCTHYEKKNTHQPFRCTHPRYTHKCSHIHTHGCQSNSHFIHYSIWVGSNLYYLDSVCVAPIRSRNGTSSSRYVNDMGVGMNESLVGSRMKNEKGMQSMLMIVFTYICYPSEFWKF